MGYHSKNFTGCNLTVIYHPNTYYNYILLISSSEIGSVLYLFSIKYRRFTKFDYLIKIIVVKIFKNCFFNITHNTDNSQNRTSNMLIKRFPELGVMVTR